MLTYNIQRDLVLRWMTMSGTQNEKGDEIRRKQGRNRKESGK
jgi:hypothetical protein